MISSKSFRTLLIIDDDQLICDAIVHGLNDPRLNILKAHGGREGIEICADRRIDVVLLDQKLPDVEGVDLCSKILSFNDQCKIILITAYPSYKNAVKAIKVGAYDYLSKPFEIEEVEMTVLRAFRTIDLERVAYFQKYNTNKEKRGNTLIGAGDVLKDVWDLINLAATNSAPVLITGETGVGKNVVAKLIHTKSFDDSSPFICINCAALPENLIEAELFGYEKGAFTGSAGTKKGLFELAEGGSLFLDELGELPLHLQSKLLGVLDDKKLRRIGGDHSRHVNTRVIAATNMDLDTSIKSGKFRSDLYYRLSVLLIHVPPLRSRIDNLQQLCDHFIQQIAPDLDISLSKTEIDKLSQYDWPGNIRELKNIIERSIIIQDSAKIFPSKLLELKPDDNDCEMPAPLLGAEKLISLKELEKRYIQYALKQMAQNNTQTAKELGISRSTLIRKIKSF